MFWHSGFCRIHFLYQKVFTLYWTLLTFIVFFIYRKLLSYIKTETNLIMLWDFHNRNIVFYLPSPSFISIYNLSTNPQVTNNSTPVKTGISGDNSTSFGEVEVANINIPPTIKHAIPVQIQNTILNDRQRLLKKIAFLKLKYYFVSLTALFAY